LIAAVAAGVALSRDGSTSAAASASHATTSSSDGDDPLPDEIAGYRRAYGSNVAWADAFLGPMRDMEQVRWIGIYGEETDLGALVVVLDSFLVDEPERIGATLKLMAKVGEIPVEPGSIVTRGEGRVVYACGSISDPELTGICLWDDLDSAGMVFVGVSISDEDLLDVVAETYHGMGDTG
jgi:hypothetical protein